MSINLTNEESMILSKLSYMNVADEDQFKKDFKGKSLKEMAVILVREEKSGDPRLLTLRKPYQLRII